MQTIAELQKQRSEIQAQMAALLDHVEREKGCEWSDDDQEQYDSWREESEAIKGRIDAMQAHAEKRAAFLEQQQAERRAKRIAVPGDEQLNRNIFNDLNENKGFGSLGDKLRAVAHAAMPGGTVDTRLRMAAATGLSEGIPADGGFLVTQDEANDLYAKVHETGQLWARTRMFTLSANSNGIKIPFVNESSRATGSRWGGVRGYWLAEAGTKTASKPAYGQIELSLKKLAGLCYVTDELLQDATALEMYVRDSFAQEFGFMLDDAVINGTGAGQPMGILNGPCLVSVAKEAAQAAATVLYENVIKMWARLWPRSQPRAVWLINHMVMPQLQSMVLVGGTASTPVYLPPGQASAAPFGTLFGRPVIPCEQCQALGTQGDIILADLEEYLTCSKGGLQFASSIHVNFVYDETAFRFVMRVDGQPGWNSVLTPYKGGATATQSPFVVLDTRA